MNMAPPVGLFGLQQRGYDNSESPDKSSRHATGKDSQFGKNTNQYPRVRLPSFTAAISRLSAVLLPVSIQHDTQLATYQQCKPRISSLWATMASI